MNQALMIISFNDCTSPWRISNA